MRQFEQVSELAVAIAAGDDVEGHSTYCCETMTVAVGACSEA